MKARSTNVRISQLLNLLDMIRREIRLVGEDDKIIQCDSLCPYPYNEKCMLTLGFDIPVDDLDYNEFPDWCPLEEVDEQKT